jgi:hypothetical protein
MFATSAAPHAIAVVFDGETGCAISNSMAERLSEWRPATNARAVSCYFSKVAFLRSPSYYFTDVVILSEAKDLHLHLRFLFPAGVRCICLWPFPALRFLRLVVENELEASDCNES